LDTAHPLANGLCGCWPLQVDPLDYSRYRLLSTLTANPLNIIGVAGPGYSFNGSSQWVSLPQTLPPTFQFSLALWVMSPAAPSTANIAQAFRSIMSCTWNHTTIGTPPAMGVQNQNGTFFNAHFNTALSGNTWYHLGSTWDGVNLRAYLNGRLDNSVAAAGTALFSYNIAASIGGNGAPFNGSVTNVVFYNRVLSDAEMAWLYEEQLPMLRPVGGVLGSVAVTAAAPVSRARAAVLA
jgi:hypothetical protein